MLISAGWGLPILLSLMLLVWMHLLHATREINVVNNGGEYIFLIYY
jgi:hypothetical protein